MYPESVPAVAPLLVEFGPHFERMDDRAPEVIKEIKQSVSLLD
jgi:hypothetical protein